MSSFGQVPLKDIFEMLSACAEGHSITQTHHHYCVRYKEKVFPTLPRGEHGKANPSIQRGVIKKMARALDIYDCAKKYLAI